MGCCVMVGKKGNKGFGLGSWVWVQGVGPCSVGFGLERRDNGLGCGCKVLDLGFGWKMSVGLRRGKWAFMATKGLLLWRENHQHKG